MNKIKDILYDKNDILIALLIVVVAAFVIYDRMGAIMEYPQLLAAEANASGGEIVAGEPVMPAEPEGGQEPAAEGQTETPENEGGQSEGTESEGAENEGAGGSETEAPEPPVETPTEIDIHIEAGSTGADIAQLLINAGLIESDTVFYNAIIAANADTKLQAGDFTIPTNASPEEIVRIITR